MLKRYWKRITGSGTIMSWITNIAVFIHGLVVTPLLLFKFDDTTLSFYYLLNTLLNLGLLADAGFGHTLQRSVAFFHAGAVKIPKYKEDFNQLDQSLNNTNFDGLLSLLTTTNIIYLILSAVMMIILAVAGILTLWNLLTISGNSTDLWIGFGLMLVTTNLTLQTIKWSSFMMGLNKVAILNQIRTVATVFKIIFFFAILLSNLGLVGLMTYTFVESVIIFFVIKSYVNKWFSGNNIIVKKPFAFDKEIFQSLWGVSWKSGLNTFGYFFISQGASLIIGQIKDTTQMANFLFTQRILTFIKGIAQVPFFAHTPEYYGYMSKRDYSKIKTETKGTIFLSIATLIAGLIGFGALGNILLEWLHIDNRIVSLEIYLVMSIILILDLHALIHGTLYISTNSVPFLIPSLITGIIVVTVGLAVTPIYGIIGMVLVQMIANLLWNNWYAPYLNFRLINWKLKDYAFDISIGGMVYWLNRFRKTNY